MGTDESKPVKPSDEETNDNLDISERTDCIPTIPKFNVGKSNFDKKQHNV